MTSEGPTEGFSEDLEKTADGEEELMEQDDDEVWELVF